jgi:hypothetical protein
LATVFEEIIEDIKDNDKKHQQMCEARSEAAKKGGGAPVGNKNAAKSRYAEPQENTLPPLEPIENDPEPIEIEEIYSQTPEKTTQNKQNQTKQPETTKIKQNNQNQTKTNKTNNREKVKEKEKEQEKEKEKEKEKDIKTLEAVDLKNRPPTASPIEIKPINNSPQARMWEFFRQRYEKATGLRYVPVQKDFVNLAKLIKANGEDDVGRRIDFLYAACVYNAQNHIRGTPFWFNSAGLSDFTFSTLVQHYNAIVPYELPEEIAKREKEERWKKFEEGLPKKIGG